MAADIQALNLKKTFGPITAVNDISFSVQSGEILGFLGPNGAGKTTTMRLLTGYLRPDQGQVTVCGNGMFSDPVKAKSSLGYLPEGAPLYPEMTPASFLKFSGQARRMESSHLRDRIKEVGELVHLAQVWNQPVETLSKGYKRRLGLAQAILHDPQVLILDEPTDGLDPNQKTEVRNLVRKLARSKAIIISTHILEEVSAVCDRAIIINDGRIVTDGTPAELEALSSFHNAVSVTLLSEREKDLTARIENIPFVRTIESSEAGEGRKKLMVFPEKGRAILHEVAQIISSGGFEVDEFHQERGRLEEVFRNLTTGGETIGEETRS